MDYFQLYNYSLEFSAFISAARYSAKPWTPSNSGIQENTYLVPKSYKTLVESKRSYAGIGQSVTYTAYNEGKPISWFTRMAWANTKYLGCAVHSCKYNRWSVLCHYSPGGNNVGKHIYEKGSSCSACPSGYSCSLGNLCALDSTAT